MVQTNGLAKYFEDIKRGTVKAVDGVTFSAHPGQITGLLGGNGAGKTTLLRMLSTVISPTSGTGSIDGVDIITNPEEVRSRIGFLSGSTAVYARLTGREFLNYFGKLCGLSDVVLKQRIEYVTDKFAIGDFMDSLCDKLSTGQKQRISIARAILHDPPVVFFDEPTTGLDVMTSQDVLEFIEECRTLNKTVIFSTHIMSEAERLCDNVIVIHDGVIRAEGTVDNLKQQMDSTTLEKAFLKAVGRV